jgi:hypothetical protein
MKKDMPILLAVLLGAVATAIGMGFFLKMANDDRARLAAEIDQARDVAAQAVAEKEKIATDASEKVEEANNEILNAQRVLADIEKERRLLAEAIRLDKPATSAIRNWRTVIAGTLGVSLAIPPGTEILSNDDRLFTSIRTNRPNTPWLSITPFDARDASEQEAALTEADELAYLVDGHLLSGVEGMNDNERTWLFRVWQSASTTHLIRLTDPGVFGSGNGVERFLGTLEFDL